MIKANRFVKEGDAFLFTPETWVRSGSAEIAFSIPGMDKDVVFPLENQTAWAFRSFSDQYIFCREPAKNLYFSGINDESAS